MNPTHPTPGATAEAEAKYLTEISERLRTQDNRITENPMFCVQTKRRDVVPEGFSSESVWVVDGEEVEEGTADAEEYNICERWETVMVAFTEEGCKEYLRQNGHNLSEPRIYVESFNRCPEMIAVRGFLMAGLNHFAPLLARVAELENTLEIWRKDYRLMEHRVVTCGILASHEPLEAVLKEPYTGKWASQQSEKVITLRKQLAVTKGAVKTLKLLGERLHWFCQNAAAPHQVAWLEVTVNDAAKEVATCAAAGLNTEGSCPHCLKPDCECSDADVSPNLGDK